MPHIDIFVARHEKKDGDLEKKFKEELKAKGEVWMPGGTLDREQMCLSADGLKDAKALGQTLFGGKGYDAVSVCTSNFLRTKQTANAILEGAGFDVEKDLYGNSRRARFRTEDRLGLGGTNWEAPNIPDFKKDLNGYVSGVLDKYFLERADQPAGNPNIWPVMARRSAALHDVLADGVEEMATRLKPQQRGLVMVITHCPTIDALAGVYTNALNWRATGTSQNGAQVYDVKLAQPVEAHDMGQYMIGSTLGEDRPQWTSVPLTIKGKEYSMPVLQLQERARELRRISLTAVQK